jgi:hypothetical protein
MSHCLVATARPDPPAPRPPRFDSGELGPLAPPFAAVMTGMRPAVSPADQAREHLAEERRQLAKHLLDITHSLNAVADRHAAPARRRPRARARTSRAISAARIPSPPIRTS